MVSISCHDAVDNAMALDVAMGGSTNTVLHVLALAKEAARLSGEALQRVSDRVPHLAKVSPAWEAPANGTSRTSIMPAAFRPFSRSWPRSRAFCTGTP